MATRRDIVRGGLAGALCPFLPRSLFAADQVPPVPAGLGAIRAVTITAPDLNLVKDAWTKFMGYRVISRDRLSRTTAAGWDAPALAGKPYLILGPKSGEPVYLRFVEQRMPEANADAHSLGWTTTEITVQNTDELYERLKNSPFKVTHPPASIPTYSYLRAMHAVGPAGEQLKHTWITEPRPDLAAAKSFVGRCFITVLAAPDLAVALHFYQTTFGNIPSPIRQLPSLQLAVVPLGDGAKIEVDNAGPAARVRALPHGGLPPGVALVTFECTRFEQLRDRLISHPVHNVIEPFRGRRAGTMRGPAGELIELLET